jgi:hypothetical protein|tara:strand:- start:1264 stop:1593 length:330 start_codon:yes stop_codon:yes gene_type:complete
MKQHFVDNVGTYVKTIIAIFTLCGMTFGFFIGIDGRYEKAVAAEEFKQQMTDAVKSQMDYNKKHDQQHRKELLQSKLWDLEIEYPDIAKMPPMVKRLYNEIEAKLGELQ